MATQHLKGIRWKRVIVAGLLSEVAVVVLISAVMISYRFLIAPGQSAAAYEEFGQLAGYYIAAPAAAVATFVCAFFASRRLQSNVIGNAVLVGVIATVLTSGLILGARPSDRPMYVVTYLVRIVAGYLAGVVAGRAGRSLNSHALSNVG